MRLAFVAGLVCAVVVGSQARGDGVSDDEWKELSGLFAKEWATTAFEKREDVINLLAKADDVRAVRTICATLWKDPSDRRLFGVACVALRKTRSPAALEFLASMASSPQLPAPRRTQFCETLGMLRHPTTTAALIKLSKADSPFARISAVDGLGHTMDPTTAVPVLAPLLDEDPWALRYAAMVSLMRLRHKSAIPFLIARLDKEPIARLKFDLVQALQAMTGAQAATSAQWKAWWEANANAPALVGRGYSDYVEKRTKTLRVQERATEVVKKAEGSIDTVVHDKPVYYDLTMESDRVVFIIDTSKSMLEPYKGKRPKEPKYTVVLTGEDAKEDPLAKKSVTLDWDKIRTAWDLVREHLIFTLRQLDAKTQFDIVTYNSTVRAWKGDLQPATPGNVEDAIKMLMSIKCDDKTNVYAAIEKAFKGNSKDVHELMQLARGPDTLYFLSDGSPTVGKIVYKREISVDLWSWDKRFINEIEDWNCVRKLQIHAVGVSDEAEHFMRAMSRATHGIYTTPGYGN